MTTTISPSARIFYKTEDEIDPAYAVTQIHQRSYLLNGDCVNWEGPVTTIYSPIYIWSDEGLKQQVLGSVPECSAREALVALDAAIKAYDNGMGEWPSMSLSQRISCMQHFTFLMLQQRDLMIRLLMWEIGKSLIDATKEFDRTVDYIQQTIEAVKELDRESSRFQQVEGTIAQIRRTPVGVVLSMGPFNYPLNEIFTTLIPAILMGNTVLFKLPKHGVLVHYPLLDAFKEAFPKGVVNTLYGKGSDIIPPIMETGKINVLAFIGSSKVANSLKKLHPKTNRLRAVLSLDAKNAAIITQHADLDNAVTECILGALSFNGQRCTALKMLFVQKEVAADFVLKLSKAVSDLKIGLPWDEGVKITPLPEPGKPLYLKACIEDALQKGARIINEGGGMIDKSFVVPAVLYPVDDSMKIYQEEQFGPVIPVVPFDQIDEPVAYQMSASHGMQVSIFTENPEEAAQLIDSFVNLVSRVNLNCQAQRGPDIFPFTGKKDSAEGTLSVPDALRAFSIRSMVATKSTKSNKELLNCIVHDHLSSFLNTSYIF